MIMRIGDHADVSMKREIYANARADGAARSAAPTGGSPFDEEVKISSLLLYLPCFAAVLAANEALTNSGAGLSPAETLVGVTGFEPAASSSRTSRNRNHVGH